MSQQRADAQQAEAKASADSTSVADEPTANRSGKFVATGAIPPVATSRGGPVAASASERVFDDGQAPKPLDVQQFTALFTQKTRAHAGQMGHMFNGSLGNFVEAFQSIPTLIKTGGNRTYQQGGNGCDAWQEWILDTVRAEPAFQHIRFMAGHINSVRNLRGSSEPGQPGSMGVGLGFVHKVVIATFPNGREIVLDPWRDPDRPVHDYNEYVSKYTINGIQPGKGGVEQ